MIAVLGVIVIGLIISFTLFRWLSGNALSVEESFEAMTGVKPAHEVQASQSGWEDYTGWFRVKLSERDVEQAAAHIGAMSTGRCRRLEALQRASVAYEAPGWWSAEPDNDGRCWATPDFRGGGAILHYDDTTSIATLLIFML